MKSQSAQGWVYSVPRDYLHISTLQAIDKNENTTFKHTTHYQQFASGDHDIDMSLYNTELETIGNNEGSTFKLDPETSSG